MIFTDTTNISTFLPDVGPIHEYPAMLTKMVTQLHTLFFSPIPSARKLGFVRCGSSFFGTQFAGDLVGTFFKKMIFYSCRMVVLGYLVVTVGCIRQKIGYRNVKNVKVRKK